MMVDMVRKKRKSRYLIVPRRRHKVAKMLSPHNSIINQPVSPPQSCKVCGGNSRRSTRLEQDMGAKWKTRTNKRKTINSLKFLLSLWSRFKSRILEFWCNPKMVGTNKDSETAFVTFGRTAVNQFADGCNGYAVAIAKMKTVVLPRMKYVNKDLRGGKLWAQLTPPHTRMGKTSHGRCLLPLRKLSLLKSSNA